MAVLQQDEETGEFLTQLNIETGEEEYIVSPAPIRGEKPKIFKIPSSYYINPKKQRKEEKIKLDCSPTVIAAVLYLLPTTIFFNPLLAIVTVALEVVIHVWAHRKNKTMKNKSLFYQSPLHIICKEFCGSCKEESAKLKITRLQEKRADRLKKYVKGIVT